VAVQLRHKSASTACLLELGHALRALTRRHATHLLVNDRVDVALAIEADGVHLPEAGMPIAAARTLLGPQRWVGVSRHDLKGLFEAAREPADYATLAPIRPVPGKAAPLGVDGFARTISAVRMPVYALGGVRAADVADLQRAGARGIAVIREVLAAPEPGTALRQLFSALDASQPG
jgi:thiamine-phosphate pyrophosphorylase